MCKAIDDMQKNAFKRGQEAEKANTIKERERAEKAEKELEELKRLYAQEHKAV